jgi:hypothetical protein
LASSENPYDIVVSASRIYWTTAKGVRTVPIGGGAVTDFWTPADVGEMALDATDLYVAAADGTVNKLPLDGSSGPAFVGFGWGAAVDGTNVYWSDLSATTTYSVMAAPLGSTTAVAIATVQTKPGTLASDGTNVYWDDDAGAIMKAPITGGAAVQLAKSETSPNRIAVDGTNVYWTNVGGLVQKVPAAGGPTTTFFVATSETRGIAVDATWVYWITDDYQGTVTAKPIAGGAPVVLAQGQDQPWGVAVDATSVYWTNRAPDKPYGGSVMKVAKP